MLGCSGRRLALGRADQGTFEWGARRSGARRQRRVTRQQSLDRYGRFARIRKWMSPPPCRGELEHWEQRDPRAAEEDEPDEAAGGVEAEGAAGDGPDLPVHAL